MKASSQKTAQPTLKYDSAIQKPKSKHFTAGTSERLAGLRGACLIRDKHRCVVSRAFDREQLRDMKKKGREIVDDDGVPLDSDPVRKMRLEAAHILPHALTKADSEKNPELVRAI